MSKTKQSRDELVKQNDYLQLQVSLFHRAITALDSKQTKTVGRFTIDGTRFVVYLVDGYRADGGTLLIKSTTGASLPDYSVVLLEQFRTRCASMLGAGEYWSEMYNACGKAMMEVSL